VADRPAFHVLVLVLGTLACTSPTTPERADVPKSNPEVREAASPVVAPVMEGPKLALVPLRFEEAAMNLKILDQPHDTHAWERGGVLSQTVVLDADAVLRVVVRVGEGEGLAHELEMRPRVEFDPPRQIRLCDRPAQLVVGHSPEQHIECIEFADGTPSRPGFIPAQTDVLVGFEHEGLGATAEWSVPTSYRELYRPLEEEFVTSLACPG
jgi:hypothetical protein